MNETCSNKEISISSLIKWNDILNRCKMNEKPIVPFANQLAFLRLDVLEALYGGATRGGMTWPY